jgi:hypothetical protein
MEPLELASLGILVVASAIHVTAHVALAWGLMRRGPAWRGLMALVLHPLAPLWGYEARLLKRSALWVVSLFVYGVALVISLL